MVLAGPKKTQKNPISTGDPLPSPQEGKVCLYHQLVRYLSLPKMPGTEKIKCGITELLLFEKWKLCQNYF